MLQNEFFTMSRTWLNLQLRKKLQRIDIMLKLSDSQVENKNVQSKSVKFDESGDIIAENNSIIASPVVCRLSSKTIVPPNSQF